eukprot:COSAG06_NODE_14026_length_1196_cov_14.785779_1_plen_156_part_10
MGKSSTQKSTFYLHSRYYLLMQVMGSLEAAMAIAKTAVRLLFGNQLLSCLVLSCLVLSRRLLLFDNQLLSSLSFCPEPVLSRACLALPCLALPCLALPCLALSCLALSCLDLSCLVLSPKQAIKPTEAETSCLVFAQVEADSDGNIDEAITGYEGA